jgi:ABC-type oligopeptide transport system ATPase subunit
MIIVGYQGIGKSSVIKYTCNVIDLESGSFWIKGKRSEDWYKIYVNIAKHLSDQGNIVFLSSHKCVRDELNARGLEFTVICPGLTLKKEWISKLRYRYLESFSEKDYKAWKNAEQSYDENIKDLFKEKNVYILHDMEYSMLNIISQYDNRGKRL